MVWTGSQQIPRVSRKSGTAPNKTLLNLFFFFFNEIPLIFKSETRIQRIITYTLEHKRSGLSTCPRGSWNCPLWVCYDPAEAYLTVSVPICDKEGAQGQEPLVMQII